MAYVDMEVQGLNAEVTFYQGFVVLRKSVTLLCKFLDYSNVLRMIV